MLEKSVTRSVTVNMITVKNFTDKPVIIFSLTFILAYMTVGTLFYWLHPDDLTLTKEESHNTTTFIDSLYFVATTLTTVGYGLPMPGTALSKVFTSLYALFGVFSLGFVFGLLMNEMLDSEKHVIEKLASDPNLIDVNHLGESSLDNRYSVAVNGVAKIRHEVKQAMRAFVSGPQPLFMILRALLAVSVIIAVGTVSYSALEDLETLDAFYLSCITIATVGFGDVSPVTQQGRLFTVFYCVIGSVVVGNVMQSIAQIPLTLRRRRIEQQILQQFGETLEMEELIALTKEGATPNVCTKAEFILGMLVKMSKVRKRDIDECEAQFRRFDINSDGTLSEADIVTGIKAECSIKPERSRSDVKRGDEETACSSTVNATCPSAEAARLDPAWNSHANPTGNAAATANATDPAVVAAAITAVAPATASSADQRQEPELECHGGSRAAALPAPKFVTERAARFIVISL